MEISFDSFLHNDDDPPSKGDSADVPLPAVSLIEGNNVRTLFPSIKETAGSGTSAESPLLGGSSSL